MCTWSRFRQAILWGLNVWLLAACAVCLKQGGFLSVLLGASVVSGKTLLCQPCSLPALVCLSTDCNRARRQVTEWAEEFGPIYKVRFIFYHVRPARCSARRT